MLCFNRAFLSTSSSQLSGSWRSFSTSDRVDPRWPLTFPPRSWWARWRRDKCPTAAWPSWWRRRRRRWTRGGRWRWTGAAADSEPKESSQRRDGLMQMAPFEWQWCNHSAESSAPPPEKSEAEVCCLFSQHLVPLMLHSTSVFDGLLNVGGVSVCIVFVSSAKLLFKLHFLTLLVGEALSSVWCSFCMWTLSIRLCFILRLQ